ncbi:GNAT superfamily N-acetyltransferase [Scopulibacillus daqui]|uniref:GNAT superfamily N-acetyltransferase n=1 Tax=Scopulibacillus daqui TaxID=1469162 RepID=A0ABS2PX16_9BACL|nr:GNAT family N-acetyltransferase [Scopulibacillus daqui]MBM7643837.1 GNAT superfamily N-acetyltransferase [Scopulibacillus daqui]
MKIRKASPKDAAAMAIVHINSWRTTYQNIIPASYLNQLTEEKRRKKWRDILTHENHITFIAENTCGQVIGFADGGKERTGKYEDGTGKLYAIYILKEYQGKGIGRMLFKSVAEKLKKAGFHSMIVWVLQDNQSRRFYEALGGKAAAEK